MSFRCCVLLFSVREGSRQPLPFTIKTGSARFEEVSHDAGWGTISAEHHEARRQVGKVLLQSGSRPDMSRIATVLTPTRRASSTRSVIASR